MDTQRGPDEIFMRMAIDQALTALNMGEVPVGAVVVCNGAVVGRGHNLVETLNDTTAHAEMQALTAATETISGKYLKECTLYVTLEPCPMCAGALAWSQIGRIVYGADDPRKGFLRFSPSLLHPATGVEGGLLAEECSDIIKEFFSRKR